MAGPGSVELSVLTQNAWGGAALWSERRRMLARRIDELDPDVVGLQEIHVGRSPEGIDQAEDIACLLRGYRTWFAPGRVGAHGEREGVALLVRDDLEVFEHSIEALTLDRDDPFERDSQRIVLRAALRLQGVVVDVLVTHLSLSRRARARTARELTAFAARERAKSGSAGAIMMGDLNALPDEEAIALLESDGAWLDAWKHRHPAAYGGTWPAGVPFRRIDYIFVQPGEGWSVESCERTPFSGSDHLGVMARIVIPVAGSTHNGV